VPSGVAAGNARDFRRFGATTAELGADAAMAALASELGDAGADGSAAALVAGGAACVSALGAALGDGGDGRSPCRDVNDQTPSPTTAPPAMNAAGPSQRLPGTTTDGLFPVPRCEAEILRALPVVDVAPAVTGGFPGAPGK
jgi:hypothetical protein